MRFPAGEIGFFGKLRGFFERFFGPGLEALGFQFFEKAKIAAFDGNDGGLFGDFLFGCGDEVVQFDLFISSMLSKSAEGDELAGIGGGGIQKFVFDAGEIVDQLVLFCFRVALFATKAFELCFGQLHLNASPSDHFFERERELFHGLGFASQNKKALKCLLARFREIGRLAEEIE